VREVLMAKSKTVQQWRRWKKKAPKVPEITCPEIDHVLDIMDDCKGIDDKTYKKLARKMERLRRKNELLRDSGWYWYHIAKEHYQDLPVVGYIKKFFNKII
tara:strand:+ start:5483 stop:5785 length:303 start_codon:yes stop_codon:yes gene_type:complete